MLLSERLNTLLGEYARIPRHHSIKRAIAPVDATRAKSIITIREVRHARLPLPQLEYHVLLGWAFNCCLLVQRRSLFLLLLQAVVLAYQGRKLRIALPD